MVESNIETSIISAKYSHFTPTTSKDNFASFWSKFRNTVLKSGTDSLRGFIQVPLSIYGYADTDPKLKIYKSDSIQLYLKAFMKENTVNFENLSNHFQLIKRLDRPEDYKDYLPSDKWVRIENMEFIKTKSGWRLSVIYMNTKEWN